MSAARQPIGADDVRYRQLLAGVADAADVLEQGLVVTRQQLEALAEVTQRLTRGVEAYTSRATASCPTCGALYVPLNPAPPCCPR